MRMPGNIGARAVACRYGRGLEMVGGSPQLKIRSCEPKFLQAPVSPQRIEGYLVTNGHANPHVEPVMEGWFEEQRRDHRRDITFMHLISWVDWVFKARLVNELRAALAEEDIEVS